MVVLFHGDLFRFCAAAIIARGVTLRRGAGTLKGGDENLAILKTLEGKAFDKAYVDHEVAYHEQVLDAIDKTLVPPRIVSSVLARIPG